MGRAVSCRDSCRAIGGFSKELPNGGDRLTANIQNISPGFLSSGSAIRATGLIRCGHALVEAACAEPAPRRLYPATSHWTLRPSTSTRPSPHRRSASRRATTAGGGTAA
ncbi:DUF6193 family natural product biosynthesis protein [Streptomyces sp. NPDC018833]|uniref:DUF6193 family natural product biosynthesis protein n=1 Tax=Streptomyces sp. NPDC018833 TaxID=3365053 RepID=UPI0037B4D6C6